VSPRSEEWKRRVAATSAQTALLDGALSCAKEGGATGDGDAVVGSWVGEITEDGVGEEVIDVCSDEKFEHAARNRTRTRIFRIRYSVPRGRVARHLSFTFGTLTIVR
jgi:hypothetical protein